MLADFEATVYDLFGYILPGFLVLCALTLLDHVASTGNPTLHLEAMSEGWIALLALVTSYLLGHGIQAVGNGVERWFKVREKPLKDEEATWKAIAERACKLAKEQLGVDRAKLDLNLYALMDQARVKSEQTDERDVYEYRKGFYRGMTVAAIIAFLLVVIAFLVQGNERLTVDLGTRLWFVGLAELIGAAVVLALLVPAYVVRWLRFNKYQVQRAVMLWVAIAEKDEEEGTKAPDSADMLKALAASQQASASLAQMAVQLQKQTEAIAERLEIAQRGGK